MLDVAYDLPLKIVKVVAYNIFEIEDSRLASCVLYVQIDVVLVWWRNDIAQEVEIHLVVKGVVAALVKERMVEFLLLIHDKTSEVQILSREEVPYDVEEKNLPLKEMPSPILIPPVRGASP